MNMNKEDLRNRIMSGLSDSLNESKVFDPKNNKAHKEAYNSFVKWYNKWKEKLGREEIRGLVRKVTNDALGDNLDTINEAYKLPNPIVNTYTGPLPKVDSDNNTLYDEETGETIATMNIKQYGYGNKNKSCIIKFKPGLSLQDKLNYRDAILKNRTLKNFFNIQKSSFMYHQPELFESLNEAVMPGQEDDHQAFDLFLWCENTRTIRENNCQPIVDNLAKKIKAGVELDETYLANSSIVDKLIRIVIETYRKEFPGTYVSSATRKNLRARIAHMLIEDANEQVYFENLDNEK